MNKPELRKIIRGIIQEQFGGGNTMTADCSQYTFPLQIDAYNTIADNEWCGWSIDMYNNNPSFSSNIDSWCAGETVTNQGFISLITGMTPANQCGWCYCFEGSSTPPVDTLGPAPGPGQTMGMPSPQSSAINTQKLSPNKRGGRRGRR